ncbi:amidohydrolase, partial [Burkholderia multivorans]
TTRSALEPGPAEYHPERAFTPAQALDGLTRAGAQAGGFTDGVGEIVPGGRANLIVVSVDPFTGARDELLDSRVLQTIVDGDVLWRGPAVEV